MLLKGIIETEEFLEYRKSLQLTLRIASHSVLLTGGLTGLPSLMHSSILLGVLCILVGWSVGSYYHIWAGKLTFVHLEESGIVILLIEIIISLR